MQEILIKGEKEMEEFGIRLGRGLSRGSVVALSGDLGSGKTYLTKAIGKGLGITSLITSPTFTIIHEYRDGKMPLYHFDVYRLLDADELFELGYEEYFYGDGVCVIEWADKIESYLPAESIRIEITYGRQEGERIIRIDGNIGN